MVFLFFTAILLVAAGFLFYTGHERRTLHHLITSTRTTLVAQLAPGFAEVKGQVVAKDPDLHSPYSDTPCAFYDFHVEEHVKRGKNSRWVTRIHDRSTADLILRDATGEVHVDLGPAELHLTEDRAGRRGVFNTGDERLRDVLMAKYGFDTKGFIFEKGLRYSERVLEEGDELYALGTAQRAQDGDWALVKGERGLLVVSDLPEEKLAGNISQSSMLRTLGGVVALVGAGAVFFLMG